jgi:hypothetical protein
LQKSHIKVQKSPTNAAYKNVSLKNKISSFSAITNNEKEEE